MSTDPLTLMRKRPVTAMAVAPMADGDDADTSPPNAKRQFTIKKQSESVQPAQKSPSPAAAAQTLQQQIQRLLADVADRQDILTKWQSDLQNREVALNRKMDETIGKVDIVLQRWSQPRQPRPYNNYNNGYANRDNGGRDYNNNNNVRRGYGGGYNNYQDNRDNRDNRDSGSSGNFYNRQPRQAQQVPYNDYGAAVPGGAAAAVPGGAAAAYYSGAGGYGQPLPSSTTPQQRTDTVAESRDVYNPQSPAYEAHEVRDRDDE